MTGRGYPTGSAPGSTTISRPTGSEFDDTEFDDFLAAADTGYRRHGAEPEYRPSISEITQDIVVPEAEFDEYLHEYPYDVGGAQPDDISDAPATAGHAAVTSGERQLGEVDEPRPFQTLPAAGRTRTSGRHRVAAPPTALRGGRAALIAMAAGAAVAAATHVGTTDDTTVSAPEKTSTPTNAANVAPAPVVPDTGPGVSPGTPNQDLSTYTSQLAEGQKLADDQARAEALAKRPLFAAPVDLNNPSCAFTSLYEMRWGSFHSGIDLACPLGTPIHAATDGVVIEAGPASGFGNWVQVRADDGTVTMVGHMASSGVLVHKGQRVTAGDTIALVGAEGFSTGPHCHFEVWKNGVTKIDPAPWLAEHGIQLPAYQG